MSTIFKKIYNTVNYWYIPLIVGALFIALGCYVFTVPVATYETLVIFFSLSFIITGVFEIFFSIQNRENLDGWGWYLTAGILNTLVGLYLTQNLQVSASLLPFVVGFTLLFRSIQGLGIAFDLRDYHIMDWGYLAILSVLGIILSFILVANPLFTGLSIVTFTALAFICLGIFGVVLSLNLRKIKNAPQKLSAALKSKLEQLQNDFRDELSKGKTNKS